MNSYFFVFVLYLEYWDQGRAHSAVLLLGSNGFKCCFCDFFGLQFLSFPEDKLPRRSCVVVAEHALQGKILQVTRVFLTCDVGLGIFGPSYFFFQELAALAWFILGIKVSLLLFEWEVGSYLRASSGSELEIQSSNFRELCLVTYGAFRLMRLLQFLSLAPLFLSFYLCLFWDFVCLFLFVHICNFDVLFFVFL